MNQAQTLAEPASPSSAAALPLTLEASKPDAGSGPNLSIPQAIFWAAVSIACFHLAYGFQALSILIIGYVFGLAQLTRVSSTRLAMWLGFGAGFLTAAPQLTCFWTLFGPGAIALWSVLGFWIALFVVVGRFTMRRLGI